MKHVDSKCWNSGPTLWWLSFVVGTTISCAPSTGSNQATVESVDTQWDPALVIHNTCIKNDPSFSCADSQAATKHFCTIAKNTVISVERLMAPFGYSQAQTQSAKVHFFASAIRIGSGEQESSPSNSSNPRSATNETQLTSDLEQILSEVAAGNGPKDGPTNVAASETDDSDLVQSDQDSIGSNACTDQKLKELARTSPQGAISKAFEGRTLAIWAGHFEFQGLASIPVAKAEEFSFVTPAAGERSSEYGWRWGRMHNGLDIAAPTGTPIFAASDGTISYAGWHSGGYGFLVEMTHPGGSRTLYAHNSRNPSRHHPTGAQIPRCSRIGDVGSTGNSTGPHLHFEIRMSNGRPINPGPKIAGRRC